MTAYRKGETVYHATRGWHGIVQGSADDGTIGVAWRPPAGVTYGSTFGWCRADELKPTAATLDFRHMDSRPRSWLPLTIFVLYGIYGLVGLLVWWAFRAC